jgi:hypothetical protein
MLENERRNVGLVGVGKHKHFLKFLKDKNIKNKKIPETWQVQEM